MLEIFLKTLPFFALIGLGWQACRTGFFTAEELDEMMYEVTEVAKFLLEVEGVDLSVAEELDAEDRVSEVMREVRESSEALRDDLD